MEDFETGDALYSRQQGEAPITVLADARSSVTGELEPMAFVYRYGGGGRVFQTVLGMPLSPSVPPGRPSCFAAAAGGWQAGCENDTRGLRCHTSFVTYPVGPGGCDFNSTTMFRQGVAPTLKAS